MASDSAVSSPTMKSNSGESYQKDCPNPKAANCYRAHTTNSKSSLEIRQINSAIHVESISGEERDATKGETRPENDHQREDRCNTRVNGGDGDDDSEALIANLPDVAPHTAMKGGTSERAVTGQDTYRCYDDYSTILPDVALSPVESTSGTRSGTTARVERRCKIESAAENACQSEALRSYIADNRRVARISTISLADRDVGESQVSPGGPDFDRRIAHSEWVRRKHEAARCKRKDEERAMKKRQEEEEKVARKKEERARLEKQNFLEWTEGKRRQELDRKAMFQDELELQKRLKEVEDKAAAVAKALYFRQWIHKKKEQQKTRHKEQESRQRKINEERERRLEQCSKAYESWRENSKNRPKPATQGLLPHQKAKPAYVNPIPWQSIVELDFDESREGALDDKNKDASQLNMNGGRTVVAHQ